MYATSTHSLAWLLIRVLMGLARVSKNLTKLSLSKLRKLTRISKVPIFTVAIESGREVTLESIQRRSR